MRGLSHVQRRGGRAGGGGHRKCKDPGVTAGKGAGAVVLGGGRTAHRGTTWAREACECGSALWLPCGVGLTRGSGVEDRDLGEVGTIWVRSDDGSLGVEIREERIRFELWAVGLGVGF